MNRLLRPRLLLPLAAGASLLAVTVTFAGAGKVLGAFSRFRPAYAFPIVALLLGYNAIRGILWYYLLRRVDVRPPLRTLILSYAVGEVTKYSPAGNYVPNYLLLRIRRASFGISSAATTYLPYSEMAICLGALLLLGLDHWTWLRPLILIGLALLAVSIAAVAHSGWRPPLPRSLRRPELLEQARSFARASRALLQPRVLAVTAVLGTAYTLASAAALLLIARGLGVGGLSLAAATAAFCFSLVVTLIAPVPTDLGSLELTGTGALVALGVPGAEAVAVMLANRLFTIGVALALAGAASVILRGQLRAAISDRPAEAV